MVDTTRRRLALMIGVGWLVLTSGVARPPAPAPAPASSESAGGTEALIRQDLRRLDRILQDRRRGRELGSHDGLGPEAARVEGHLRRLESRARELGPAGERLRAELRSARRQWVVLERSRVAPRPAERPRPSGPVVRLPAKAGAPFHDTCANALPIGYGTVVGEMSGATNDGSASCGLGIEPDVWFRYSSPVGGRVFADTGGSTFDAVLSVHSGCPGTAGNERACSDSLFEPAAVSFLATPGDDVLLRVAGFAGESGTWALSVGPAGAISGKVIDAATGAPLPSVEVLVYESPNFFTSVATTDPTGEYAVNGLAAGSYFAIAGGFTHYIAELYDDIPCRNADCDPTFGTPIRVGLGEVTAGVDFALDLGGTVAGTVTDAGTGAPIPGAGIEVFDRQRRSVAFVTADEAGRYAAAGLTAGSYFVRARSPEHQNEVYDDLPCPFDACSPLAGTPITVALGATAGGIDFALDRLGSLSGTVTESATGAPIPFADIAVWASGVGYVADAVTDEMGTYRVGGLGAASYRVVSGLSSAYAWELYDGIPCSAGACDPEGGTPVAVELDADTPGIDFALERLGSISGVVTESATGDPIPLVGVEAESTAQPAADAYALTDAAGRFTLTGLLAGDWFVRTAGQGGEYTYLDELYDDLPCPRGDCLLSSGTPVAVGLETDTPGVDFALERLGSISGTVTDAASGEPLDLYGVRVYDADGREYDSFTETDAAGRYTLRGLLPGSYFVGTSGFSQRYRDEFYDGVPCSPDSCEATAGMPVAVTLSTPAEGIDFALERLGSIAGTVRDDATGEPIHPAAVEVVVPGALNALGSTDETGRYVVSGLEAGSYSVIGWSQTHQAELYDGVPCPDSCDLAAGTLVAVGSGATTEGIDFSLVRRGSISGTVRDAATGEPVADLLVEALPSDRSGFHVSYTDAAGRYTIEDLPAGTYRATAIDRDARYVDERFAGVPCPRQGCDLQAGTPIAVSLDATTLGIDFSLERGATITGRVTDAATGQPAFASLRLSSTSGQALDEVVPDFAGRYAFQGLAAGTYFVTALGGPDYADEVYEGRVCSQAGCDPMAGTPIRVAAGGVASGIDFSLEPAVVYDCTPSPTALCLAYGRFRVEVAWRDFAGASGAGQGVQLTRDTGYFWFFGPDNVELVVKVLDACDLPDFRNYWVFAAGLTDVEAVLTVTDTASGEVETYTNPEGTAFLPIQDTAAFRTCPGAAVGPSLGAAPRADRSRRAEPRLAPVTRAAGACVADAETLCLAGDRFAVRAAWETPSPQSGAGQAVRLTADTGYFWFFGPGNVEVVVKVLDACGLDPFRNFWVFAAGLTDVEVTLEVTDTVSGETREWVNPQATAFQPILETGVFDTCP